MSEVGKALYPDITTSDGYDVIHKLVAQVYSSILELKYENIIIADITSSLNPFDARNHISQIEPSGIGGEKIAKILVHLLTNSKVDRQIYRFLPSFFYEDNNGDTAYAIVMEEMSSSWKPTHPKTIDQLEKDFQNGTCSGKSGKKEKASN